MDAYGGLARSAPIFAGATAVAAFASLGLPGLSGFIAEFHVFLGSMRPAPVATALAFLGILITAALFLLALQRIFLGEPSGEHTAVADLRVHEAVAVIPLLAFSLVLGIFPRFVLDVIEPASRHVVDLVAR
jgi:NADH-quinone oxidoreductase subunit M